MKPDTHPKYKDVTVTCGCGSVFVTRSTMEKDQYHLEVCAACHPFYTGTQKIVDTAGRVDRFRQKYGSRGKTEEATATEAPAAKAAATETPAAKAPAAKKPAAEKQEKKKK